MTTEYDKDIQPAGRITFPIQAKAHSHPSKTAQIPRDVYMAAYEVYCHVYAPQAAMIQGHCRGGFGTGEFLAFLYARAFPKHEWRARVEAAYIGLDLA